MASLPWFRFYNEAVDDEKLRLLAFEDRWHFVAILCCKGQGILDETSGEKLYRRVAVKLGLSVRELEEVARRLAEEELIDSETLQPLKWGERQYESDSSTKRVREFRARQKKKVKQKVSKPKRDGNVTVTVQDTDTDTEKENNICPKPAKRRISYPSDFQEFWAGFPTDANMSKKEALDAWKKLDPESRQQATASLPGFQAYCRQQPDYRPIHACRYLSKRRFEGHLSQQSAKGESLEDLRKIMQS